MRALALWGVVWLFGEPAGQRSPSIGPVLQAILLLNAVLLAWRVVVRMLFTGKLYGWRQAMLAPMRMIMGNVIAVCAAWKALWRYAGTLRGRSPAWGKTAHMFPNDAATIP